MILKSSEWQKKRNELFYIGDVENKLQSFEPDNVPVIYALSAFFKTNSSKGLEKINPSLLTAMKSIRKKINKKMLKI